MSSRNPPYDSSESRRSPRSRSPGRYNEFRDDYRGGSSRGGERRRSIDGTSRPNFTSRGDSFRESGSRDSSRDFASRDPPRDPPRGPKALLDGAPSGPRASSYSSDFRGDFGYRGDFRGSRGRPRGRGGWRDDSRDRGRESERDYRSPRDERAPPFRDERGRDRDRWERNDNFRGRRPSPPSTRGRSPSYSGRESVRDAPASQDVDRLARRDSRDAPSSVSSPSSETAPAFRGSYTRGRGIRGRGRGGLYDDFPGRNPSPESWNRRAQPSATPPPQVPAFGSASANVGAQGLNIKLPASATPPTGPAGSSPIGVPVPTAPRAHTSKFGRDTGRVAPNKWHNAEPPSPKKAPADVVMSGADTSSPSQEANIKPEESSQPPPNENEGEIAYHQRSTDGPIASDKITASESTSGLTRRKRRLICGRRVTSIPSKESIETLENASDDSDADSVDSISRAEFLEGDLKQAEQEWSKIPPPLEDDDTSIPEELLRLYDVAEKEHDTDREREEKLEFQKELKRKLYDEKIIALHPLRPAPDLKALLLTPYIETAVNEPESIFVAARQFASKEFDDKICIPNNDKTDNREPIAADTVPKLEDQESVEAKPFSHTEDLASRLERQAPDVEPETLYGSLVQSTVESQELPDAGKGKDETPLLRSTNGRTPRSRPMLDQFDKSDEDELSTAEKEEEYAVVRSLMHTPPVSSLPHFTCKRWDEDPDFLKTLEPNPTVEIHLRKSKADRQLLKVNDQDEERQLWKQRYYSYRKWTDFSDDPVAIRSREKFSKSRAKAAAEAAAASSSTPITGTKPEPSRRTGSRWATDHDIERILQQSKQEAKESEDKEREKEREERDARAKSASAKEASIPDMYWDEEERLEDAFIDRNHLVPFERSFARLEFGEPIDNFTPEECEIFEKVYLEMPKQWGKIAEALPGRDYKACIQHYYLAKHSSNLKEKFKKQGRKKGRRAMPKGAKPKSNALTVDIVKGDDTEDGQDTENGSERRRPRRAAAPTFAFESTPGDAETQSSASASTPGRKSQAGAKGDASDTGLTKRKTKAPREKGPKQSKSSQLLAAAPASTNRLRESPAPQPAPTRLEAIGQSRFPIQYDSPNGVPATFIPSPYASNDKANSAMTSEFDPLSQQYTGQERLESAAPTSAEGQDRRNLQQTSSYWSVPEQTDFPALLRHFGTDWHGIAKFMTSKTHIMVKNYYLRQVDSGRMSSWRDIAEEADDKRKRGEPTGPLPKPTVIPKRRIDGQANGMQRSSSSMEGLDDLSAAGQAMVLQQGSPSQPSLSSRFPALAQAGPVPQSLTSSPGPVSILGKHLPQQSQQPAQQMQQSSRGSRGPALGYFNTDPQRPIMQAASAPGQSAASLSDPISQRTLMAAQEAHLERQQALRLEREQAAQVQAQAQALQHQAQTQAMQHQTLQQNRQLQMKQETDAMNVHQYEQYSNASMQPGVTVGMRSDAPGPVRTAPPQQYQPRVRNIVSENSGVSSPAPGIPRAPLSAPPASQEQYAAPPAQQPSAAPAPQRQEPARKSNIMSLLNDEPTDRVPPPKRVSEVSSSTLQRSQTPPLPHAVQTSRYASHPPPSISQPHTPVSQQMSSQLGAQHQPPSSQHSYSQSSTYATHQPASSAGPPRSYTPNSFENRAYPPQSTIPQKQPAYSQSSRQPLVSQPPRREPSLTDHHRSSAGGYSHSSTPSQSSIRLQESAYSATPPPGQPGGRPKATSPLDHSQPSDRDFYSRQPYQAQQQSSAAGSPRLGPTYHPQSQQQPPHRQMAYGGPAHMAASPPPSQYPQHPPHRSRRNSFDNRYPPAASSPPPQSQGYTHAPPHQVTPLNPQYQQPHSNSDRYESSYERERRLQDEAYHQRRLDESRR